MDCGNRAGEHGRRILPLPDLHGQTQRADLFRQARHGCCHLFLVIASIRCSVRFGTHVRASQLTLSGIVSGHAIYIVLEGRCTGQ